jgi:hypothetical protein
MSKIPDFTDSQIWTVESTLKERYPESPIELQQVDTEIRLSPHDRELTQVPGQPVNPLMDFIIVNPF